MGLSISKLGFNATIFSLPIKFECTVCNQSYLHPYSLEDHHYPDCPDCQQAGLLMGIVESEDMLHHPLQFMHSYMRMLKAAKLHLD
ncbi:MAG: hypothetical protein ACN6NX_03520 [Acinetobacter sp.]